MLRSLFTATVVVLALASCGGGEKTSESDTSDPKVPAAQTTPPKELGALVKSGFGQRDEYVWVTAIVHNNSTYVGQTVTVNFNVLDDKGSVLKSEAQVESFSQPDADHIIGTQVSLEPGMKAAKVEATLDVEANGTFSDKPFPALPVSKVVIKKSEYGGQEASFEVSNPTSQPLKDLRLAIACADAAGNLVGGGSEFPELVPANGKVRVDSNIIVSGNPASCSVYTGSLGESEPSAGASPSPTAAAVSGSAESAFKIWVDQFSKKDWKAQYVTLVSAQQKIISEKEYVACRNSEQVPDLKWSKLLSVTDVGTITIPGTSAKLPATKVSAQVTTSGMQVPVDARMLSEDGLWKWSMTQENVDNCA
ncbi:hypothetical protein GCM10022415_13920 [Knoellia locipacati]|uniref:Lipoprotein n=1 Tax=Knoellia locipacati TaxID=882824 RepID=A0A512SZK4_9MICO|nr:hypothetical protein [Knoellia locipacati]GEQ13343.1 hypothetical protein KLO01_13900 [Knoellia locipacati]